MAERVILNRAYIRKCIILTIRSRSETAMQTFVESRRSFLGISL